MSWQTEGPASTRATSYNDINDYGKKQVISRHLRVVAKNVKFVIRAQLKVWVYPLRSTGSANFMAICLLDYIMCKVDILA